MEGHLPYFQAHHRQILPSVRDQPELGYAKGLILYTKSQPYVALLRQPAPSQAMEQPNVGAIIEAVCRAYKLHLSEIKKPKSKRGNLIGTHLSSDARITLGYLLLEKAQMPLRDVCHLLNYSYNYRRSYELRRRHKIYFENDAAYRGRYEKASELLPANRLFTPQ